MLFVVVFLLYVGCVRAQGSATYPIGISNCGIFTKIDKSPTRAVTLNQGATEIMLALGLQDRMVGTAYLDDEIWPEFKTVYAKIPVVAKEYPTAQVLMAYKPDFLFGSYASAFQAGRVLNYSAYFDKPCTTAVWHSSSKTYRYFCRREIQSAGIQTYLQVAACEDAAMRMSQISQDVIKSEIWDIANIFGVQANAMKLIENIDQHFKSAFKVVSDSQTAEANAQPKVLWIDSQVSRKNPMIAACCGAPNLIIKEAGGVNAFPELGSDTKATWASGDTAPSWDDIARADPDVLVIIDASWDPADKKIFHLCNSSGGKTKDLRAVQNRAFITVPFSGSTLGVKNGAVAYNLAEAMVALVRGRTLGSDEFAVLTITADGDVGMQATGDSGVRTYLKLPTVDVDGKKVNLDEFCPGKNKLVVAPPQKQDSPFAVKFAVYLPFSRDAFDTGVQKAFRQVCTYARDRARLTWPSRSHYFSSAGDRRRCRRQRRGRLHRENRDHLKEAVHKHPGRPQHCSLQHNGCRRCHAWPHRHQHKRRAQEGGSSRGQTAGEPSGRSVCIAAPSRHARRHHRWVSFRRIGVSLPRLYDLPRVPRGAHLPPRKGAAAARLADLIGSGPRPGLGGTL